MMRLNKKENHSKKIFKNTVWNLIGGIIILIIQFLSTPYIVNKLGEDAYGIWSLVWILLSYLGFLTLGLGTASIKYISENYGKGDIEQCNKIFWTSLWTTAFQGIIAATIFIIFAPAIVKKFFNIKEELLPDAIIIVKICGLALLVDFILGSFQAVPSALQRLDIVNKVGLGINITQILGIVIILIIGGKIVAMAIFSLIIQSVGVMIYFIISRKLLIQKNLDKWDKSNFWILLKFGGFVSLSAILAPLLVNIEKLLISNLLAVNFLTYYIVPYNLLTRFYLISGSLTSALFPAMSEMSGSEDKSYLYSTTLQGIKILSASIGWSSTLLFIFAKDFLTIWMGANFANIATPVLQILCIAFWINIIAHIPFTFLRAYGKPEIPAIYHLIESFFYVPVAYFSIKHMGISGAAFAWCFRVFMDTFLLLITTAKIMKILYKDLLYAIFNISLLSALAAGLIIFLIKKIWHFSLIYQISLALVLSAIGIFIFWSYILRKGEKEMILAFILKKS